MFNKRLRRAEIAAETLEIIRRKGYRNPYISKDHDDGDGDGGNSMISIASDLETARNGTLILDKPTTQAWMKRGVESTGNRRSSGGPNVSVVNAGTFTAARDLVLKERGLEQTSGSGVCCLNFASAKNPGGGFLNGSQAQEEALTRASGLYECLLTVPLYYETNRKRSKSNLGTYEDLIIYSPNVPVFREANDELVEDPWTTAIITAPAPNRSVLLITKGLTEEKWNERERMIRDAFRDRIDMVLSTAMKYGHRSLVLGAWGCGVFRNDPKVVARLFRDALRKDCFEGVFDTVVFAVLDWTRDLQNYKAFEEVFSNDT